MRPCGVCRHKGFTVDFVTMPKFTSTHIVQKVNDSDSSGFCNYNVWVLEKASYLIDQIY